MDNEQNAATPQAPEPAAQPQNFNAPYINASQPFQMKKPYRAPVQPVPSATRDFVFACLAVIWSVLMVSFELFGGFKTGVTISYVLFFILSTAYFAPLKSKPSTFSVFCGIAALVISTVFTIYNDADFNFIIYNAIILLTAIYINGLCGNARYCQGSYMMLHDALRTAIYVPFANLKITLISLFRSEDGRSKKRKHFAQVLVGAGAAIPVLCVVLPLLASSDAAFEGLASKVFVNIGEYIVQLILGFIVAPFVISLLFALNKKLDKKDLQPSLQHKMNIRIVDATIANSFLAAISLAYIVYLFSQLAYFFSAFSGILPSNYSITTAEYARRGFFEMAAISAINLAILFAVFVLSKRTSNKIPAVTKALSLFLCIFTLVLISTATSKMVLYINSFGMTRLRILTSCFMVILFFTFVAVIIRLFSSKFPYMKAVTVFACIVLAAVAFADVDTTVAHYNIWAYQTGKLSTIDVDVLCDLSDSAVPYLEQLLDDDEASVRREARWALAANFYEHYYYTDADKDGEIDVDTEYVNYDRNDFRSFNISSNKAEKILWSLKDELPLRSYYDDMVESYW